MRRQPLFLAREDYRRRRLRDAARLLPVAGWALFLMPLLIGTGIGGGMGTAAGGIYIFAVWIALALAAAILSRRLSQRPGEGDSGTEGDVLPDGGRRLRGARSALSSTAPLSPNPPNTAENTASDRSSGDRDAL